MTRQHRRTWQKHEQRVAEQFGTTRTHSGEPGADVLSDWVVAECKSWRSLPARVEAALKQAEASADEDRLPVAVIHGVGRRYGDDLVVLRWKDFVDWFGKPLTNKE